MNKWLMNHGSTDSQRERGGYGNFKNYKEF